MTALIYSAVIYQVLYLTLYLQCLTPGVLQESDTNYFYFTNEEIEAQGK